MTAHRSHGQAMIELMIGLVAIIALFAFLLQMGSLAKAHTETVVEARQRAGQFAMVDANLLFNPDFIRDWKENLYGRHNADDEMELSARQGDFKSIVVGRAGRGDGDWALIDSLPDGTLSRMNGGGDPDIEFGLVNGTFRRRVALSDLTIDLLYRADRIDLETSTWLTLTTGLY